MEKINRLLIGVIICLIMIFSSFCITTTTAFPTNPGTQAYFDKICEMPPVPTPGPHPETFWIKGGDCDDRAIIFADYLKSKGAKNVQICWVCRMDENGTMIPIYQGNSLGHVFVVWGNHVYNPSYPKNRRYYNTDISTFKKFLKSTYGFNTWYFENQTVGTPF